jgi:hypothetical protein
LRLCAHHWTDKPADPVLAAKIRISPSTEASAKKVLTGRMNPHNPPNKKIPAMR